MSSPKKLEKEIAKAVSFFLWVVLALSKNDFMFVRQGGASMNENDQAAFNIKYVMLIAIAVIGIVASLYVGNEPNNNASNAGAARQTKPPQAQSPQAKIPPIQAGVPVIMDATVVSSVDKKEMNITFPYSKKGAVNEKLDFKFKITYAQGQPAFFYITPDDCIEIFTIDGRAIGMTGENKNKQCDLRGFRIDLSPNLHPGINFVHILIRNNNGPTGLNIRPVK